MRSAGRLLLAAVLPGVPFTGVTAVYLSSSSQRAAAPPSSALRQRNCGASGLHGLRIRAGSSRRQRSGFTAAALLPDAVTTRTGKTVSAGKGLQQVG